MKGNKGMAGKALYKKLAEEIGAGESVLIPVILEKLANGDEARVLLATAPPATVEEISKKAQISPERVLSMVGPLFQKGLIFMSRKEGQVRYYRVRSVPQFHDSSVVALDVSREVLSLWQKFMETEWVGYGKKIESLIPKPIVRVVPVNIAFETKTQILAFEDVKNIVDSAKNLAVTKCSCRVINGKCKKPLEVCIQINRAADYALERGTGRKIGKEEAIQLLKLSEEEGLVHITNNTQEVGHVICNCCQDCCMNWPLVRSGMEKFVAPSRFLAKVDAGLCSGCETCKERCFFEAISLLDDKAVIDSQKCMGCGLCMVTCPTEAIGLKEVREVVNSIPS
jgi:ferredoxin